MPPSPAPSHKIRLLALPGEDRPAGYLSRTGALLLLRRGGAVRVAAAQPGEVRGRTGPPIPNLFVTVHGGPQQTLTVSSTVPLGQAGIVRDLISKAAKLGEEAVA